MDAREENTPGSPEAPASCISAASVLALGLADPSDEVADDIDLDRFIAGCPDLELHACLGCGGMGLVYRARQVKLDRMVAVKLLRPQLAREPEFAARFEREGLAMAKLDHRGIVRVYDFGKTADIHYLVMEVVEGPGLRELMQRGLEPHDASRMVEELCLALAYAHEHGVVHRDIKPENILTDTRGGIKIADFGLAKLRPPLQRRNMTNTRRILGTPQYMAPEQITDPDSADPRSDVFAVGVVFYEMLTGRLPLGRFPAPTELDIGSPAIDAIVLRALANAPEDRFQSTREMAEALANAARATPLAGASPGGAIRTQATIGRALAVGLALFAGAVLSPTATDAPAELGHGTETEAQLAAAQTTDVSLLHWPATDLSILDPTTVGVVGVNWSELKQAPALSSSTAATTGATEADFACENEVFDRTHKLLIAFGEGNTPVEIVARGDWDPADLQRCIKIALRRATDEWALDPQQFVARQHKSAEQTQALVRLMSAADPTDAPTVSLAHTAGRALISLRGEPKRSLAQRLEGNSPRHALSERLQHDVDFRAPLWLFGEAVDLPLGARRIAGEVNVWEKISLHLQLTFDDEVRAGKGSELVQSYATILRSFSPEDGAPQIQVGRQLNTVSVHAAFDPASTVPFEARIGTGMWSFQTPPGGEGEAPPEFAIVPVVPASGQ